eukprot:NODE_571_length_5897_cov_0.529148.p4 type:complete len:183 gc:universal NODE_571_length_5897_cov_0.529148:4497-3949(-)
MTYCDLIYNNPVSYNYSINLLQICKHLELVDSSSVISIDSLSQFKTTNAIDSSSKFETTSLFSVSIDTTILLWNSEIESTRSETDNNFVVPSRIFYQKTSKTPIIQFTLLPRSSETNKIEYNSSISVVFSHKTILIRLTFDALITYGIHLLIDAMLIGMVLVKTPVHTKREKHLPQYSLNSQ